MRLLFTSLATHGHMYPLLPLAVAARDAGHHVVFATADEFLPTARKAGLEAVPAGLSVRAAFGAAFAGETRQREEISTAELDQVIASVFGDVLPRRFVTDLGALFERQRPDLVVYEAGNTGGAIAAELAGLPALSHGFGRVSQSDLGSAIQQRMAACAAEFGIGGADFPSFGNRFIDICPESAQAPEFKARANRVPLRPVGWNEPGDLPAGIADEGRSRPLIYLTLGTAMGSVPVLGEAIAGLAVLDADVLVATGPTVQVAELGDVPANVRLEAWVPQADLLPHVDLVVHHGGSGTTLGAFGAGLPQLLLPQGADQFTNADTVFELGVGDRLLGEQVTAEAVTEQARRLLTDESVHSAAERLAAEVAAMPTPAEVAAQLPALAV
ncbi:glycosyltransferase [Saccharopolyspora sp. K220]|uniref:glycosyltransferase n=1 Tax=Saccharopolyspora soli TaxID=2926618 RepID=UPI001F5A5683|nr:glycosyltransferase [Saccharopolyspora soli]MCI2418794.1 glycosyltransferase [Saccharopolyspora soli]